MADIIFDNHTHDPRRQTFIIPLTYQDIALGAADIPNISHGGDIWEMRVDLLSPSREPLGATNLPPLSYVQAQIKFLQSLSEMPILFTIRTVPQGGKFPPDAENEALALMLMAVEERCKYIDVEIEWSPEMINAVVEKKGSSKIITSFHDWTGDIRWMSDLLRERYTTADAFGGKHTQIVNPIQILS